MLETQSYKLNTEFELNSFAKQVSIVVPQVVFKTELVF